MNALTMAYGLTRTEFIPKVRFTFSLPKPRHFYSFFFPFPRVTILTRTFPRTETFSINYIPLAAPSLRYLISYLSPRIQRTVFQPRDSLILMDVKKKKNVYATHRTPFPSSRDSILKRNVIEPFSNSPSSPPLNKFSPARDTTADSS